MLLRLSKTNAFYRRPSVISESIFFVDSQHPSPPFQCCNTLRGHLDLVTILKRGEGVEMSKLDVEKLTEYGILPSCGCRARETMVAKCKLVL